MSVAAGRAPSDPALVSALLAGDSAATAAAFVHSRLLLVADPASADGLPAVRVGRSIVGWPLVWGFTDEEALRAWDHAPARHAVLVDAAELLGGETPPAIVLNGAGPGATVLGPPRGAPMPADGAAQPYRPALASHPLADPRARAELRQRAREQHDRGVAARDPESAVEHLAGALDACRELGDRLHAAAVGRELAAVLDAAGETIDAADLRELSAETFADLGAPELAAATREGRTTSTAAA